MSELGMAPDKKDQSTQDLYAFGQTMVASAFPQQEDPVAPPTSTAPPSGAGNAESPWAGAPKAKAQPQPQQQTQAQVSKAPKAEPPRNEHPDNLAPGDITGEGMELLDSFGSSSSAESPWSGGSKGAKAAPKAKEGAPAPSTKTAVRAFADEPQADLVFSTMGAPQPLTTKAGAPLVGAEAKLGIERQTIGGPEDNGPSADDIDFNALLDDLPGGEGIPSGGGGGDGGSPSYSSSPKSFSSAPKGGGRAGAGLENPAALGGDPFNMEELDFDKLDGLDGPEQKRPMVSEVPEGLAGMELDFDPVVEIPGVEDTTQSLNVQTNAATAQRTETTGEVRSSSRGRRQVKTSPWLVLGLVMMGLVMGTAALVFSGALETLLEIFGEGKRAAVVAEAPAKIVVEHKRGPMEYPTPDEYRRRVESLQKKREMNTGDNPRIEDEVLWVLAWFNLAYPREYAQHKDLEELFGKYRKRYALPESLSAMKLDAIGLVVEGRSKEAAEKLDAYLKKRDARLDELMASKTMAPEVLREDRLLHAMLLFGAGRLKDAAEETDLYLEASPKSIFGRYLRAQMMLGEGKTLEAKALLLEIQGEFPEYTNVLRDLATVAMKEENWDEVVRLADLIKQLAADRKNPDMEMDSYRLMVQALRRKGAAGKDKLQEVLEKVVKQNGDANDMVLDLADLYLEAGKPESALTILSTCKTCDTLQHNLLLIKSLKDSRMYERALQVGQSVLDKQQRNTELLMLLAELSKETGRDNSAVNYLRDALTVEPENLLATMRLVDIFLALKKPGDAREVLLRAERYHAKNQEILEKLVQINLQMEDDSGAAGALRKLHTMLPENDAVRLSLVEVLTRLANYKEAVPHFDYLAKKSLISSKLRPGYAMALREMGRVDDAVEVLRQVLEDDPSDYQTARNLAEIYFGREDYFGARRYLEMARRIRSDDPQVHYLLGLCCRKLEDLDCTLESLTKATELAPDNVDYLVENAKVLYQLSGKVAGKEGLAMRKLALTHFNRIAKQYRENSTIPDSKKDPEIFAMRGKIYFDTGYYDEALGDFRQAVMMDSHRVDLLLAMGDSLFHINRYEDAKKYYKETLEAGSNKAHAYFYLGKINLLQNKQKEAKQYFLDSVGADAKAYPDAYRFLGNIYKEERFSDLAAKYYKEYLKHAPMGTPARADVQAAIDRLR
jgi:tetratricopeptide (TPR) repeat protein